MVRILLISVWAILLPAAAAAQVFVVGGGLAKECYELALRDNYQYRTAVETCTRALREETMNRENRAATYVNRGVFHMRDGNYDMALEDYAKAKDIVPDLGAAYLNEGAAYIYKREFESALAPLNKAIELDTTDMFAAYYNRAIARENTGDVPGAYYDFKKALELKPGWELAERQLRRFRIEE